jgi:CRP/FNR family cyclic AMP-dependent transcriptional regulator
MNYSVLKNLSLFESLQESELQAIAAQMTTRVFPKNAIIVNEGDKTDSLYVILSGKVKVFSSDEDGREVVFNTLGPYEYFGELALVDEEPRSASVMTVEASKLSMISRNDFVAYLTRYPSVAVSLLKTLVRRVRIETENVKNLALLDVYGRVAKTLLDLAVERDGKLVTERITQREIANMVGASREMVGRILKDLKTGGYITVERGGIIINEKLPPRW